MCYWTIGCRTLLGIGCVWIWLRTTDSLGHECSHEIKFHALWCGCSCAHSVRSGENWSWMYWHLLPLQETQSGPENVGHRARVYMDRNACPLWSVHYLQRNMLLWIKVEIEDLITIKLPLSFPLPYVNQSYYRRLISMEICSHRVFGCCISIM